jgi:hypothetical protein
MVKEFKIPLFPPFSKGMIPKKEERILRRLEELKIPLLSSTSFPSLEKRG